MAGRAAISAPTCSSAPYVALALMLIPSIPVCYLYAFGLGERKE